MREIKFRAWTGECFESGWLGDIYPGEDCQWDGPEAVLEQYTGLKDKNGREIYEGDILSFTMEWHHLGVVQFAKGMFGLNWDYKKSTDPENKDGRLYGAWGQAHNLRRLDDGEILSEAEIVGNIHETPELLSAP